MYMRPSGGNHVLVINPSLLTCLDKSWELQHKHFNLVLLSCVEAHYLAPFCAVVYLYIARHKNVLSHRWQSCDMPDSLQSHINGMQVVIELLNFSFLALAVTTCAHYCHLSRLN